MADQITPGERRELRSVVRAQMRVLRAEVGQGAAEVARAELDRTAVALDEHVRALRLATDERDRLAAQRDAVLALADGWESDAEAFTSGEAFRRYIVAQIHDQYGVSE